MLKASNNTRATRIRSVPSDATSHKAFQAHHRQITRWRYIVWMPLQRVQPIIPVSSKEPFNDSQWLFEFKYDGFRALCYIEQDDCRFISRRGNVLERFSALCQQVAKELGVEDAIIDGEVIAADESGRPQFYDLLRRPEKPTY